MSAAAGGVFSGLGRAWQLRGSPCRCFVAGTPVQMADGTTKRICDVEVGDQVLSRDPATGKDEAKTVTATVERHAPSVVDVALRDAKTGQAETLICTPEHPLYVQGQGWVEAGSVGIGTSIVSRAGPALQVTALTWQRNKAEELAAGTGSPFGGYTVYNLTVADDHTFFVGTTGGGTWVHNACYTEASEQHAIERGHSADADHIDGQSQFYPGEGGQKFTDEVLNHDEMEFETQSDGRTRYTVQDLGRRPVGLGEGGLPARGGQVIVEGSSPIGEGASPGDVATQYPY